MLLSHANPKPGMKKFTNMMKPFDVEFKPLIADIDAAEVVMQKYADGATMETIQSTILHMWILSHEI